jgi:putative MATE family efflux protein
MLMAILNTLGRTKPGRNFLAAGFFLNLLLDPWFIFGGVGLPPLGITGIALATVLVQLLGCIYIGYEVSKTDLISISSIRQYWRPNFSQIWRIIQQGLPNTVDTMGVSLGFFILTIFVGRFGQNAVAAMGSASRIEQVFLLPLLGLNIAVLSLVARNNGAGQIGRVHKTFRTSIFYGVLIMSVTMVLAFLLARPIMGLFTSDETIIQIGVNYVRIRSLGLIPNAVFFMSASAMRGVERPLPALVLNFIRFVGLPWLFIIIFVENLGYGLTSIWVTSTVGFYIAAVLAYILARWVLPAQP